ncbi:MAG: hypothetical protein ACYC3G_03115 [Minisyncoccota bacterium]
MSIIISSNGGKAVRVNKSPLDKEKFLQEYIYKNPETIPLYDIKEDIRLLVLARELGTESGPIDAIGIDGSGELYIIETKLYKNPDKRTVIAQALDYGASLWNHSNDFNEFLSTLDHHSQKVFKLRTTEKIKEFFNLTDEEVIQVLEKTKANLNDGVFHFVVLMDKIDDRLKDLIRFVNQNSQFDIYAVEFEYYKHESQEIIIPKIFGAEVKKDIAVSTSSGERRRWTEEQLLEDARKQYSDKEYSAFKKIYDFSKEKADEVRMGTGGYGSFNPIFKKVCLRSLYTLGTNGRLSFNFEWIKNENDERDMTFINKYAKALKNAGFTVPENYEEVRPSVLPDEWAYKADIFIKIISDLI